jgi:hypothetical protein
MAISTGNGYCECSSGYVFQKNIFGDKKCVSRDTYCENKYGYGASYNSLDEVCKCGYGKVFQKKIFEDKLECVSCYTKYGLHAEYNSSTKGCQCEDGYIAKDKVYGDGQECVKIEEEETKTNTTKDPVLDKICKSLYGDLSFWGTASKRCLCFNSSITELVPCVLISDTKASTTNTTKSKNNVMQSTDKSWEKIKRGMSKTEVKNILGYPLKTVKISDKELYFYDQKRKKRITFQNERVTNILKRQ